MAIQESQKELKDAKESEEAELKRMEKMVSLLPLSYAKMPKVIHKLSHEEITRTRQENDYT